MRVLVTMVGGFGLLLLGLVVVAIFVAPRPALEPESQSPIHLSTAVAVATVSVTPSTEVQIGRTAQVGEIDLTFVSLNTRFDSKQYKRFNSANVSVRITATNVRGPATRNYQLLPSFSFRLVDSAGIATAPTFSCAGCPDALSSVELVAGGSIIGNVYFTIPAGKSLVQFEYSPLLSQTKTIFELR